MPDHANINTIPCSQKTTPSTFGDIYNCKCSNCYRENLTNQRCDWLLLFATFVIVLCFPHNTQFQAAVNDEVLRGDWKCKTGIKRTKNARMEIEGPMQTTQNIWYTYSVNIGKHKKIQHKKRQMYMTCLVAANTRDISCIFWVQKTSQVAVLIITRSCRLLCAPHPKWPVLCRVGR